jgi:hypothetical protein
MRMLLILGRVTQGVIFLDPCPVAPCLHAPYAGSLGMLFRTLDSNDMVAAEIDATMCHENH